jgi:hypothetical protein
MGDVTMSTTNSPNRLLAAVFGTIYLLVGLLGFLATSGVGFFATSGGLLFGLFEVNIFHNFIHLIVGAGLLIAGLSAVQAAKAVNNTVGGLFLLLGIAGLFLVGTSVNILAINTDDNVLHLASGAILLAVGLGADKQPLRASSM